MKGTSTYFDLSPAEKAAYHAEARRQASTDCLDCSCTVAELDKTIKLREETIEMAVVNETGDDGKPIFSNADKRKIETTVRCEADEVLVAAREERLKVDYRARAAAIEAQYQADMIRVLCAFGEAGKLVA